MKRHENRPINSHTLWLEYLNQRSTQCAPSNKPKQNNSANIENENSKSFYKTQEEYYDENIFLKKNVSSLKGENEILKSKIRKIEEELTKKDKQMTEFISCLENKKSGQDSSVNNFIVIKKLKQNIFHLKSEIKCKENEILNLKSEVKYTNINEMKIQTEAYLQEVKGLQQLIVNIKSQELLNDQNPTPVTTSTKSKPFKTNGKYNSMKRNKELIMENKNLKKELEKIDQNKLSADDDSKILSTRKEDDFLVEIDRLKRACKEVNLEKNDLQIKYDELNSKYKLLSETFERKEAEFNLLKRKGEQKSVVKNEIQTKPVKLDGNDSIQNLEYIQSVCKSYISRDKMIENINSEKATAEIEDLSKVNIISSALMGYLLRQKLLNK